MDRKVFTRVLVKILVLLFIIGAAATGAAAYQGQRQSTAAYTMNRYISLLLEDGSEKAYALPDQSDADAALSPEEFKKAVAGKQYSLYSSCEMKELEKRRDSDGNEYTDFQVDFRDAAGDSKAVENFTVKKQSGQRFGMFDVWKVLGDHCMVRDFKITVPAGSDVYLDAEKADSSWMTREKNSPVEVYVIPKLLPGEVSLTIRHPVLESVNTTFDTSEGSLDYSTAMQLKESAQGECKETGVAVMKNLLAASAKQQADAVDVSLEQCKKEARSFVKKQGDELHSDGSEFVSMAVSAFVAEFGDPEYSEEDGNLQVEMKFSYHYRIKKNVTSQSEDQVQEDGTPVEVVQAVANTGNSTGTFTMSYVNGAWRVTGMDFPVAA